jgi:hypothetical protein
MLMRSLARLNVLIMGFGISAIGATPTQSCSSAALDVEEPTGSGGTGAAGGTSGAHCGNGVIEDGEVCDGPMFMVAGAPFDPVAHNVPRDITCHLLGLEYFGELKCSATCQLDTSSCTVPGCGNGVVDPGEDCDGAIPAGVTCSASGPNRAGELKCQPDICKYDTSNCVPAPSVCGNGQIETGEACDIVVPPSATCSGIDNTTVGELKCLPNCQLDTSSCRPGTCGDGVIGAGEECDGPMFMVAGAPFDPVGHNVPREITCHLLGLQYFGELKCSATCQLDTSACVAN